MLELLSPVVNETRAICNLGRSYDGPILRLGSAAQAPATDMHSFEGNNWIKGDCTRHILRNKRNQGCDECTHVSCILGSPCWEGGMLELCHTVQYRCLGSSPTVYMCM
jgi:hypothetical protein